MPETSHRLILRVLVKLFSLFGLGAILYALLSGLNTGDKEKAVALLQYSVKSLSENQSQRLPWSGGNLILVKRSDETVVSLQHISDNLLDPLSSHQPANLPPDTRSLRPDLFVAFDRGTDLGCPLNWILPGDRKAPRQPWSGGFHDSCGGSWYDAAGRVLKGQQASRNLYIPPYRFIGEDLLEIGLNGDNPSPAN